MWRCCGQNNGQAVRGCPEILNLIIECVERLEPMEEVVSQPVDNDERCEQHIMRFIVLPQ